MLRHGLSALCLLLLTSAGAHAAPPQQPRFVPGVIGAWNGLSQRGDALAAHRNGAPDATTCKHYQGVARKDGPDGTPYFLLTQSGTVPFPCGGDPEPGILHIVRMTSRGKHGERMGTNILPYEGGLVDRPHLATDREVKWVYFDGRNGWPAYRHTGGVQVIGDVLIVGADDPFGPDTYPATIMFIDVADPENPVFLGRFDPPDISGGFGADPVGITAVKGEDGSCCRYLLVSAGGFGNEQVRFFRSRANAPGGTTYLKTWPVEWDEVGRYSASTLDACLDGTSWPTAGTIQGGQHQMLNLVREGSLDGPLYLVGGRRDGIIANDFVDEYLDLYQVNATADGLIPGSCPFSHVDRNTMGTTSWGPNFYTGSFSAGSSVYVSPSGELIVYKTAHDSDPALAFGEYRLRGLVRANSPTLRPTAVLNGPFTVPEGSSLALTGQGAQAITKAYVQLFQDAGVGLSLPSDHWLSIEYDQRFEADYHALRSVAFGIDNGGEPISLWETASSMRWFAPPGCTMSINDYPSHSDEWPGPDTVLLRGDGQRHEVHNLSSLPVYAPADEAWPVTPVPAGITPTLVNGNDDIEGVTFYHDVIFGEGHARRHSCESYYNKTINLSWDLDGNGSFEANGSPVTFSAASLDGPSTASARARGQHPTDTSSLGSGDPVSFSVAVTNVPPQVGAASVMDSLGRSLDGGANVAVVGLPVRVSVDFTDPGLADTQGAQVTWGDGSSSTSFDTFSHATGGVTGALRHQRVYATPGTFTITATITDDDGGATPVSWTITVLSLKGAMEGVANELTARIALATDPKVTSALRSARDELIGNHAGQPPTNGAVDKLDVNDPVGAITKLRAAVSFLLQAQSLGSGDLTPLCDLLGLVGEGIATAQYERAKLVLAAPRPAQVKTLQQICDLIVRGHQKLTARQYLSAFDDFRQAADKAVGLAK